MLVSVRMIQKTAGFLLPYISIGIGIFMFHNAWLAILSYHIGILSIVILSKKKYPLARLFKSRNYNAPVIMGLTGVCGGLLVFLLWPYLAVPGQIADYARGIGLTEKTWPFFVVYFILANALFEEYFWRGYLDNGSIRITLNDVVFSGYHIAVLFGGIGTPWLLAIFLILTAAAWAWRQINRQNEGLLPSVACHVAADISVILVAYSRIR